MSNITKLNPSLMCIVANISRYYTTYHLTPQFFNISIILLQFTVHNKTTFVFWSNSNHPPAHKLLKFLKISVLKVVCFFSQKEEVPLFIQIQTFQILDGENVFCVWVFFCCADQHFRFLNKLSGLKVFGR